MIHRVTSVKTHWKNVCVLLCIHYITLHCIALHCITLHCITWHYIHYTTHCTLHAARCTLHTPHYTLHTTHSTLRYVTLRYITLHYITLRYITLHYITYIHTEFLHRQNFKASILWRQSSRWICVSTTLSAKSSRTWPGTVLQSHSQRWGSGITTHGVEVVEVLTRWSLWTTFATEANIIHPGLQAEAKKQQGNQLSLDRSQVCNSKSNDTGMYTFRCMCVCVRMLT